MNCNCPECLKWLEGDPGPVLSIITWGICLVAILIVGLVMAAPSLDQVVFGR